MGSYSCCSPSSLEYNQVKSLSAVLKLVSEESRLKILCILRKGEHCVTELLDHIDLSQSLTSHHLKDMKSMGIVADSKKGLKVYYYLTPEGKRITDLIFKVSSGKEVTS